MGFPVCLVRRHNILAALSAVGVAPETHDFPATVVCPKCQQKALRIFDDVLTDGPWLSCDACSVHGDIITFAAYFWNISLLEAFTKFADRGLLNENDANRVLGDYERRIRCHDAADAFWADARAQIWNHNSDVVACCLRELGLRHEVREHYGLVGVAHQDQINKMYEAAGRQKPRRIADGEPSIVFPFYDLPGRLSGFLVRQYGEFNTARQSFIPLTNARNRLPEAGYFLLNTALAPEHPVLKTTQIISDSPLWALKTQCQHLLKHSTPLPVMASYSGPEAESFGAVLGGMPPATRVFHSVALSPELISRACRAKGYVSTAAIRHKPPMVDIAAIRAGAKTWQDALAPALVGAPEIAAENFAKRLTVPHDKLHTFFNKYPDQFSQEFRERVLTSIKLARAAPTRCVREAVVVERDHGWWTHTGRKICNVQPKITEVLQFSNGKSVYRGVVRVGSKEYEFEEASSVVERLGLFGYVRTVLAPHDIMVIFSRLWNANSAMLAMQLHPPKVTAVSSLCGWDENTNTFRFAEYELTNTGDVRRAAYIRKTPQSKDFPEPTPVATLPLRNLLTDAHENSVVWGLTAAVVSNLVAPMLQKDYEAVCVDTGNEIVLTRIADALYCATVSFAATKSHSSVYARLNKLTDAITWPIVCRGLFNDDAIAACAPRFFNRALVICGRSAANASLTSYGWTRILAHPAATNFDATLLRDVVPAYIQHVLQTKTTMFRTPAHLIGAVLTDLHTWLRTVYGATFNLPHANTLLRPPGCAHSEIMQEISAAVSTGKIDILPQHRRREQSGNYFVRKKDQIWLNRRAIERYFYMVHSPAPNWSAVVDLLQQDNVYIEERIEFNKPGVVVRAAWFEKFLSAHKIAQHKEIG
jgi:hypothetical protein